MHLNLKKCTQPTILVHEFRVKTTGVSIHLNQPCSKRNFWLLIRVLGRKSCLGRMDLLTVLSFQHTLVT